MDKSEFFWIDVLRALATICVVMLHISASLLYDFNIDSMGHWWVGNIYDGSVRFSVPIFFMISGALLLSKDYALSDFMKKRFIRLIPPFLFWSLVYIAYTLLYMFYRGDTFTINDILNFIGTSFLEGSQFHLWFVYMIIGLYLLVPMVRKWIRTASPGSILIALFIWLVFVIFNYGELISYKPTLDFRYYLGYLGYMILGYFLLKNNNKLINNKWVAVSLIFIGNALTIVGTYFISLKSGSFISNLYSYLTVNVILSAAGVFLFFKNFTITNDRLRLVISFISRNSYGIYLVHALIMMLLSIVGIDAEMGNPLFSIPLTTLLCVSLSSLVIWGMKKVKITKYIAG